jgi:hypothetical protein
MEENKSKISNTEWWLVIGALFTIDAIQIGIEWLLIWFAGTSVVVNFCIDLFVGMSFGFYLHWRGENLANPKRLFGLLGTMGLEMIPGVDELPLWGLDGIYNMIISKSERVIKNTPIVNNVVKFVPKIPGAKNIYSDSEDLDKAA